MKKLLILHFQVKRNLYDIDLDGPSLLDPEDNADTQTCPNPLHLNKGTTSYAFDIRTELKDYVNNILSTEDGYTPVAIILCYWFLHDKETEWWFPGIVFWSLQQL